jgi:hypothetical protein
VNNIPIRLWIDLIVVCFEKLPRASPESIEGNSEKRHQNIQSPGLHWNPGPRNTKQIATHSTKTFSDPDET